MNKNKLVKIIALSAIFTSSVAVLAACRGDGHSLSLIEEQAATCTTDGHNAYYMCSHCDSIFEDADAKTETTLEAVKINKLGHDMTKHEAVEAECTKPGNVEYYTCSREEGKYFNAQQQEISKIETTKPHDFSGEGTHAYVQPTVETEGSKAYWQCNDCHNVYADSYGDTQTTVADMKIDRVKENLDGVLTEDFYNPEHALVIGSKTVKEGGIGFIVNGKKETDGIYLHIVANYNTSADDQVGDHGKIGVLVNFRNEDYLNLPGNLGTCLEQTMYMELYLSGRVNYHDANTVKYFNTKTNTEEGKAKYTTTWELFLSYEDLSKANGGKLAEAFEVKEGKTVLKQSYAPLMSFIGNMTHSEADKFENPAAEVVKNGDPKCDEMDNNTWLIWYSHGYGDWSSEQKYMALGKDGFFMTVPRAVDTYTVNKNDCANATITVPETVDFDQAITGKVTVAEGYVFSGIKANGKVVVTKGQATSGNVYDYSVTVSSLGLKWFETEIELEFVITKLDYENISFTLKGVAGGKTTTIAEDTTVVLENEFGDRYETTVGKNGVVMVQNVLCQDYVVKVTDYIDGKIDVIKGGELGEATLAYQFAIDVGNRSDLVDLSEMNEANASITLGEQGVNGVNKETIAVQIKLPDEMKNAPAYVLYTTVNVNGEVKAGTGAWLQRFAIRFAEGDANNTYKNKFVVWWDDLGQNSNPSAIWADNGTTCGGGGERQQTYDWLASMVMDGLQLKVVRNGGYVAISAYNIDDEKWYTLLEGTTSATAKNDIAFFVSGESFTFSEIAFEALEIFPLELPAGGKDGIKGHLKATNGDIFTLGGVLTSEEELAIPADSIAYTEYDNVEIGSDKITITGNGVADRNSHSYNHATYILPEAVRGQKQVSLVFNVKDTNQPAGTDDWAARRFGVQIGAGAYGFYFWTSDKNSFDLNHFVVGTLDMNTDRDGQGIAQPKWAGALIRSANGLDVQVVRLGTKIVINFKDEDGKWVTVGEMTCADVETEVKFVGGGDTWEVSAIAAGKLELKEKVDPAEGNNYTGNVAYYTDGTHYYMEDGSVSSLAGVTIKQVDVTLSAAAKELDGTTEATLTDGAVIELKGKFQNYTYTVGGTNNPDKMLAGTYEAYLYGYAYAEVVVPDAGGAVEIVLVKTFAYTTVGTHGGQSGVEVDGTTVTIKGNGLADDNKTWAGKAEIVLSDELQNRKNVVLTFTLKDTHSPQGGWHWAARRFGVTMQGENGGFMCFTANEPEGAFFVMGTDPGKEDGRITFNQIGSLVRSQNGVNMRVARVSDKVLVYVQIDEMWVKIGSFDCNSAGNTQIMLYGEGDTWQFSNIAVAEYTATEATVKKGELPQGVTLELSAQTVAKDGKVTVTLTGGANYLVSVNGKEFSVGSNFEIAYNDYALGLASPEITVSVLKVTDLDATSAGEVRITSGNINLDVASLNGKEIMSYARYSNDSVYVKNGLTGNSNLLGNGDSRYGGGFAGDDHPVNFTANGQTGDNCLYLNPGVYRTVTLHVKKGTTQLLIYTGAYNNGNKMTYRLSANGITIGDASFQMTQTRAYVVTFNIDTSAWTEESRDIDLYVGATTDCELAAIVALGNEFQKTYNVSVTANAKATIALTDEMTTVNSNGTISGTVTPNNNCKAYYVMVAGKKVLLDSENKFSVSVESLDLATDAESVQISAVVSDTDFSVTDDNVASGSTIDLSASDIIWWRRYGKDGHRQDKEGVEAFVDNGFASQRGGDDSDCTFTSGGTAVLPKEFACTPHGLNGDGTTNYTVTLTVTKGVTQIVFYTGTWDDSNVVTFKFMESGGTELITSEVRKGSSVRHTLTLSVDTTSWEENETRKFKVFIGGGVDAAILEAITVHTVHGALN